MSLRLYLLAMSLGTLLCTAAWVQIIRTSDPHTAPWFIFFFFYATLFLALVGSFTLGGFFWRIWRKREAIVLFRHVRKTFRQGVLFALLVTVAAYLKSHELLAWWSTMLLILMLVLVESIILTKTKPAH